MIGNLLVLGTADILRAVYSNLSKKYRFHSMFEKGKMLQIINMTFFLINLQCKVNSGKFNVSFRPILFKTNILAPKLEVISIYFFQKSASQEYDFQLYFIKWCTNIKKRDK
jgi:hypothetical protein